MNSAEVTFGDGRRAVFFLDVVGSVGSTSSARTGVPYDAGLSSSSSSLNDLYKELKSSPVEDDVGSWNMFRFRRARVVSLPSPLPGAPNERLITQACMA